MIYDLSRYLCLITLVYLRLQTAEKPLLQSGSPIQVRGRNSLMICDWTDTIKPAANEEKEIAFYFSSFVHYNRDEGCPEINSSYLRWQYTGNTEQGEHRASEDWNTRITYELGHQNSIIFLSNVDDFVEGCYWCSINVTENEMYVSQPINLTVVGKFPCC